MLAIFAGSSAPVIHLANVELAHLFYARQQIVTQNNGYLERHACRLAGFQHGVATGLRIHAAGVGDHLDLLLGDLSRERTHDGGHEVCRIARLRISELLRRHDRHGDLGQVVAHQTVDIAVAHELDGGGLGIAPEAGMAADSDGLAR